MNFASLQPDAWKTLCGFASNAPASIPQALVLEGPEGSGKMELCLDFFQWLQQQRKPHLKVVSQNHVDLMILEPQGQYLQIDQFRELKKSLYFAPLESSTRFVILNQAHRMTIQTANSLLKTLEEPPVHTKFFLIVPSRQNLIPTILSRCQFVRFQPLAQTHIEAAITEKIGPVSAETLNLLTSWMQGGLSKLEFLSEPSQLALLEEILSLKSRRRLSQSELGEISERWASGNLEAVLEWLCCLFSQNSVQSQSKAQADLAFQANHLRQRLLGNANRKLVALSASLLFQEFQAEGAAL